MKIGIIGTGNVGCACAAYYPETNGLVPLYSRDRQSGTPTSKSVPIRIFRSETAEAP